MNKYDIRFIILLLIIVVILFLIIKKDNNYADVYYNDKLILKIDLNDDSEYIVDGYNGIVKLEVKNNKLRVKEETSLFHLCSKQGWVNSGVIVCLPNKIVINFSNNNLDTISR